ncbi:MFS transporter [Microbulbifer flavimaris]|uniref:MFS transporter n=1 Tax=Microbulbifer flavimaris TaxID=1781068 RepID=A0ABX4I4R6_9GAMM|nr:MULTISPECIES: organoarsenical effux MFS transporter ArsJ [Microbulbifer]KUJ84805.1 MFS transporter permease [Microbulbifer sp. ZGT114]PCO06902.1 MFS transporter [Microbulbifer flavimaris]
MLATLSPELRQYLVVTANYWAFTLTDGALRMLVVLYFHQLGYSPLQIALLFVFYEAFGVVTNLLGGWLGALIGLNRTMNIGLGLQVVALAMLMVPDSLLSVPWVMLAQALSGIAKDLNKMSAKSSIKLLVPADQPGRLYHWVAVLTGSKNALKGFGFFLGGLLLATLGFQGAVFAMALALALVWLASLVLLKRDLGRTRQKQKFRDLFSKSRAINLLAAARVFLFAARDVWFVVALPVYLSSQFGWDHWQVGGFLALWVIGYGVIQSQAPRLTGRVPDGRSAFRWAAGLSTIPAAIALLLATDLSPQLTIIAGLLLFGGVFAVNSGLHSYLIVQFARQDGVSMDVGFYYMANAAGRLAGTLLSGWLFQVSGLSACLWISALFLALAALLSLGLPRRSSRGPLSVN